jgi:hypothetical protein
VYREPQRLRRSQLGAGGDCFTHWPGLLACPLRQCSADGRDSLAGAHGKFTARGESGDGGRIADDRA